MGVRDRTWVSITLDVAPDWATHFAMLHALAVGDEDYIEFWGDEVVGALMLFIDVALDGRLYAPQQVSLAKYLKSQSEYVLKRAEEEQWLSKTES